MGARWPAMLTNSNGNYSHSFLPSSQSLSTPLSLVFVTVAIILPLLCQQQIGAVMMGVAVDRGSRGVWRDAL